MGWREGKLCPKSCRTSLSCWDQCTMLSGGAHWPVKTLLVPELGEGKTQLAGVPSVHLPHLHRKASSE